MAIYTVMEPPVTNDDLGDAGRVAFVHDGFSWLALILPPGHPLLQKDRLTLADVAACDLLLREKGSSGRAFLDTVFEAHDLSVSPLWESASTEALVRAVAAGIGLSILPERLVRRALASGAVLTRPIEGASLVRTCHIVWHRNKYLSPSLKLLIGLIREE